jgi:hypothetical protein
VWVRVPPPVAFWMAAHTPGIPPPPSAAMPPQNPDNPFEAPAPDTTQLPMLATDDPSDFVLQNDFVICGPLFVLPKVCWKSGTTELLQRVRFRIDQASFKIDARPIDVIGYISKSQRRRDLWQAIRLAALLMVGLVLLSIPSLLLQRPRNAAAGFIDVTIVTIGVSLICTSALLHVKGRPIVRRYRAPNLHYVHGLPPSLLTHLRSIEANRRSPSPVSSTN